MSTAHPNSAQGESLECENRELRAYLKAFCAATIIPEQNGRDVGVHEANPTMDWSFSHVEKGDPRPARCITGGQVRRAMELVGYDVLKTKPAGRTISDDLAETAALRREVRKLRGDVKAYEKTMEAIEQVDRGRLSASPAQPQDATPALGEAFWAKVRAMVEAEAAEEAADRALAAAGKALESADGREAILQCAEGRDAARSQFHRAGFALNRAVEAVLADLRSLSPANMAPVDGGGLPEPEQPAGHITGDDNLFGFKSPITTPLSAGDGDLVTAEIEAFARSIAAFKMRSSNPSGSHLPDELWRQCIPEALARPAPQAPAASAGGDSGFVLVPREATPEQYGAGGVAQFKNDMAGIPVREAVGNVYRAMVAKGALAPTAKPGPAGREEIDAVLAKHARDCLTKAERDDIRDAILAARPVAESVAGWRPIKTAPKDGTLFAVYASGAQHDLPDIVCLCAWHEDAGFCVDELREPTHWMPLPKPPATAPATPSEGRQV